MHQNRASVAYMGNVVTLGQAGGFEQGGTGTGVTPTGVNSLEDSALQKLFRNEPERLEEMLEAVIMGEVGRHGHAARGLLATHPKQR